MKRSCYHGPRVFLLPEHTVISSARETMVSYLFKTLRRKHSLPLRALSLVQDVPDKKHVLSRKTGRHGSSCTRMRPWHVLRASARERAGTVYVVHVWHTPGAGARNFRPTYTRVIYYVARGEHMSHLHIAWYRKLGLATSDGASNMWKISTKGSLRSALVAKEIRVSFLRFLRSLFPPFFFAASFGRTSHWEDATESRAIYESVPIAVYNTCQQAQQYYRQGSWSRTLNGPYLFTKEKFKFFSFQTA